MQNTTPLFPDSHFQTLCRKPHSASQNLSDEITKLKQKPFNQLGECFRSFIPNRYLRPLKTGLLSRRHFLSKESAFWALFSQVLGGDGMSGSDTKTLAFSAMKSKFRPRCQLRPVARHAAN